MKTPLLNLLSRCTVVLTQAAAKTQRLQVRLMAGELKDDMELFEQYGFTSVVHSGASGLALFFGGDRSHGVVVLPGDKRYRPTDLQPGEVAVYSDEGARVVIRRGRIIEVECDEYRVRTKRYEVQASEAITLNSAAFSLTAQTATSSAVLEAPDLILNGVQMVHHHHPEHDGPSTGEPL